MRVSAQEQSVKHLAILSLLAFVATSVAAQELPTGCYVRDYSNEHLKQHPDQVVDRISILFVLPNEDPDVYPYTFRLADVQVLLADQGHAARSGFGGMRVSGGGSHVKGSLEFSSGSCDGGAFEVVASDKSSVTIDTYRFHLGAGCGDEERIDSDLSEGLRDAESGLIATRYLLYRAPLSACKW